MQSLPVLVFLVTILLPTLITGECCWSYPNPGHCVDPSRTYCCRDCSNGSPCCSYGKCNWFCCNCPLVGSYVCIVQPSPSPLCNVNWNKRSISTSKSDIFNHMSPYYGSGEAPRIILRKCDTDRDDAISHDEFLECYKERSSFANISQVFLEHDLNGDRFITIKEIDADAD